MIYSSTFKSPVGSLTFACKNDSLIGVWIEGQKYFGETLIEKLTEQANVPIINHVKKWLDDYFSGKQPNIKQLSLAPKGTPFRHLVWDILCEIPYGKTITYGDIAKKIAFKTGQLTMPSQAVGGAVGHNPIAIIIPCHRVIGANGNLTGYAGGINNKIKLLEIESIDTSLLSLPKSKINII